VPVCPSCGADNPIGTRFCGVCGAALAAVVREVRKTVTVVFVDLVGSTALGERLDPEALRETMRRYHAELRRILERHGGQVEKFIGDAVMAVFGLPQVHEDDALRAVRAAAEIRDAVGALGLEARIGVNTGQVVAGEGETLVTGDAVNVAARLEQTASAGEVLLGEQTYTLVRDTISAEALEPRIVRGKAEPVSAFRLVEVLPQVPAFERPIEGPFVGREAELSHLEEQYRQAVDRGECRLCTVVGPPGIGKSRVARELLSRTEAQVLIGRCLPYGEGITYWPISEMLGQLPRSVAEIVARHENADAIAARIAGAVGAAHDVGAPEEISWAFRQLLEALANEQSLIVVVDDIQWAEPALLDLLEYVVAFSQAAPLLLLCLARADLFDRRPSWANPRPNASTISLEPLSEGEAETLASGLVGTRPLSVRSRNRLVEAAEGNPLFVHQLVAMQAEHGPEELEIPPTIQALLAARIDRLEPDERTVLERASVEGRLFHRGAVAALLPEGDRPELGSHLMSLVRKEFIRPDRSLFPADDAFRFGHILIRDAAYDTLPKRLRAELHERYADWLIHAASGRDEFEEFLGYHFEHAFRNRAELDPSDERARGLGDRAAGHLAAAAERALARGDIGAATNLTERAAETAAPEYPSRPAILEQLGEAYTDAGAFERAAVAFDEAIASAEAHDDRRAAARVSIKRARLRLHAGQVEPAAVREEAETLIPVLEQLGDDQGLATAWLLMTDVHNFHLQTGDMLRSAEAALAYARRARAGRAETEAILWVTAAALVSLEPVTDAIRRCERILDEPHGPVVDAHTSAALGGLRAFQGDVAEWRRLYRLARDLYADLGMKLWAATAATYAGLAELAIGDLPVAESELRIGVAELQELGATGFQSTQVAQLARAVSLQGRHDEAEQLAGESLALSAEEDLVNLIICGGVRARAAAARGDFETAITQAQEAVDRGAAKGVETVFHADALMDLAEVMRLAGRPDEEAAALREALRQYELKGNVPCIARARALLTEASASPLTTS